MRENCLLEIFVQLRSSLAKSGRATSTERPGVARPTASIT